MPADKRIREVPLLGHEEKTELPHGSLYLADGLLHCCNPPFGRFDWLLECLALHADDG